MFGWFNKKKPPQSISPDLEHEARAKLQELLDGLRCAGESPVVVYYSPEDVAHGVEDFAQRALQQAAEQGVQRTITLPFQVGDGLEIRFTHVKTSLESWLEALVDFLNLHPQERAFIRHLVQEKQGRDTMLVFADWLEENGREEAGERMRQVASPKT